MNVDVIIIGAGLAGVSAALEIASRTQASIALVERREVGSNNPTPMTFTDVVDRFNLQDAVIGSYRSFTFHSPLGNRSSHKFNDRPLVALDYRPACRILLARASQAGNLNLHLAAAQGLERRDGVWEVTLQDELRLRAPLLIDASGRGLFASRRLNLPTPRGFSHCYGARLANCAIPDPQESFFFAPSEAYGDGGGWLYPLEGGRASFGFAVLGDTPVFPGGDLKAKFNRAWASFEPYASWFRQARLEHAEAGSIPIYPLQRFVEDGLMIVGDAAAQATIWSCMGSHAALQAGQMAGAAAVLALQTGRYRARVLEQYQKTWDLNFRRIYRRNGWIAPVAWGQSEQDWNRQIPLVENLAPEQMVARLRINWPVPTLPQVAFVRAYDFAGRVRRGVARRVRYWLRGRREKVRS